MSLFSPKPILSKRFRKMENINDILQHAFNICSDDLGRERPMRRRFCFPIDKNRAILLLSEAYRIEVEGRQYTFSPTKEIQSQMAAVAEWLTNTSYKPSLLLYGLPGTGKTTMAKAVQTMAKRLKSAYGRDGINRLQREANDYFSDDVIQEFERMETAVLVPYYCTALDVAEMARDRRDQFSQICKMSFLIVDDIGPEPRKVNNYGNECLPIAELLQRRYDQSLPTIITTNLGDAEIEGTSQFLGYGRRIMDRLNEMCEKIPYGARSFRR